MQESWLAGARRSAKGVARTAAAAAVGFVVCTSVAAAASVPRLRSAGIPVATQRAFSVFSADPGAHVASASGSSFAARVLPGMTHNRFGHGADLASARVVTVSPSVKVVVLAGPHGICVGTVVPAGSAPPLAGQTVGVSDCNSTASAEQASIGGTSGGRIAFGIVPNGNRTITITTSGGRRVRTPVIANVFYVTGLHGDRGIAFHRH
jgi:hypothetical protein